MQTNDVQPRATDRGRDATGVRRDWSVLRVTDPSGFEGLEARRLAAQARAGDTGAFGQIYVREHELVARLLRRLLRTDQDVEDVTQQVFLRALESIGRFDPDQGSLQSWLTTIALNLVRDGARQSRRCAPVPPECAADAAEGRPGAVEIPDAASADLDALLEPLSRDQRTIIVLRYVYDLTPKAIGAATGRTADAVCHLQSRAIRALRSALSDRNSAADALTP